MTLLYWFYSLSATSSSSIDSWLLLCLKRIHVNRDTSVSIFLNLPKAPSTILVLQKNVTCPYSSAIPIVMCKRNFATYPSIIPKKKTSICGAIKRIDAFGLFISDVARCFRSLETIYATTLWLCKVYNADELKKHKQKRFKLLPKPINNQNSFFSICHFNPPPNFQIY